MPIATAVGMATTDRRQSFGKLGEDLAAKFLERKGYRIILRNFNARAGPFGFWRHNITFSCDLSQGADHRRAIFVFHDTKDDVHLLKAHVGQKARQVFHRFRIVCDVGDDKRMSFENLQTTSYPREVPDVRESFSNAAD